jgi:hypothetical protein
MKKWKQQRQDLLEDINEVWISWVEALYALANMNAVKGIKKKVQGNILDKQLEEMVQGKNRLRNLRNRAVGLEREDLHKQYREYRKMVKIRIDEVRDREIWDVNGRLLALESSSWRDYWKVLKGFVGLNKGKIELPRQLTYRNKTFSQNELGEVWRNFFKEVSCSRATGTREAEDKYLARESILSPILDAPISKDEVKVAVARLRRGKSVGLDGISAEVLKAGGEAVIDSLWILCSLCFIREVIPSNWSEGIIVPIFKKGDRLNPQLQRYHTIKCSI